MSTAMRFYADPKLSGGNCIYRLQRSFSVSEGVK